MVRESVKQRALPGAPTALYKTLPFFIGIKSDLQDSDMLFGALRRRCVSHYLFTENHKGHILLTRYIQIKFSPMQFRLCFLIKPKVISNFRASPSPAVLAQLTQGISAKVIFYLAEIIKLLRTG